MKLTYPITSRSSMMQGIRWTEIVMGKVKILMRLDFAVAVKTETECFVTEVAGYEVVVDNWIGGQTVATVDYAAILFNLNRLLYEQAKDVMEPILDQAFTRPKTTDGVTSAR